MSAYRDALAVTSESSDECLALAAEILTSGTGVVMFEEVIALRRSRTQLICEVVDPMSAGRRCENEFEVLIENAQRKLEASRLRKFVPDLPRKWVVVEDFGTHPVELWHSR
jgi:hypothetical protein